MSLTLSEFSHARGDRLFLVAGKSGHLGLSGEAVSWRSWLVRFFKWGVARQGGEREAALNCAVTNAFYVTLERSEGAANANRAMKAVIGRDWCASQSRLSSRTVRQVIEQAQLYRTKAVVETDQLVRSFIDGKGIVTFAGAVILAGTWLPKEDKGGPLLVSLFRRHVKRQPDYGHRPFTLDDLQRALRGAIAELEQRRDKEFSAAHPGLKSYRDKYGASIVPAEYMDTVFGELQLYEDSPFRGEPENFAIEAREVVCVLEDKQSKDALRSTSYDPSKWSDLRDNLHKVNDVFCSKYSAVHKTLRHATKMNESARIAGKTPVYSARAVELLKALKADLMHRIKLHEAKLAFLSQLTASDPSSKRVEAYVRFLHAHATFEIYGKVIEQIEQADVRTNEKGAVIGLIPLSPEVLRGQIHCVELLKSKRDNFLKTEQKLFDEATQSKRRPRADLGQPLGSPDAAALGGISDAHLLISARKAAQAHLRESLTAARVPKTIIERSTSDQALKQAFVSVLNESNRWLPIRRDIVVDRDGVPEAYKQVLTPAAAINSAFAKKYGGPKGVSALTGSAEGYARNLHLNQLFAGDGTLMSTIVGHGDLGLRGPEPITPSSRGRARAAAADEIVTAAFFGNPRLAAAGQSQGSQSGRNRTPKSLEQSHVDVSLFDGEVLTAQAGARGNPEMSMGEAHLDAFDIQSGAGEGIVELPRADGDKRPAEWKKVSVNRDVIGFCLVAGDADSINPAAMARLEKRNHMAMERFIGDPGSRGLGSWGTRPDGWIGRVHDSLEMAPDHPDKLDLLARLQAETDVLRSLWKDNRSSTDGVTLGQQILYLQHLADRALDCAGIRDWAATMSSGCSTGMDHTALLNASLNHRIISVKMGGDPYPGDPLGPKEQAIMDAVAVSGYGDLQLLNTGVPGSVCWSSTGNRFQSREVRRYLRGVVDNFGNA